MRAQATGQQAEEAAARHLTSLGMRVLARNVRARCGEIDLVALDGPILAIVEVRARRAGAGESGHRRAAESIGPAKRRRIARAARYLLAARPHLAGRPVRFDVVTVEIRPDGATGRVRHLPDAAYLGGW